MTNKPLLTAILALFFAPSLYAQPDLRSEEEAAQRLKRERQGLKTAEQAMKLAVKGDFVEVTYDEVMRDPDNVGLNFRYARTLLARGDNLKAAATLERILMVNPRLSKLRLFYVAVLLRLDNLDDAKREITTLTHEKLSPTMRLELEDYLKQIRRRQERTRFRVSLSAGLDYDDNKNSAPAMGVRLVTDVPVTLDEASTRTSDTSKTMSAGLSVSRDLGYQEGHSVFASMNYYRAEQTRSKTLNLQSYSGSIGMTYKTSFVDITPSFNGGHILVAQTTYQRNWGPSVQFDKRLGERLGVFATAGHSRATYSRTAFAPVSDQRTGDSVSGGLGLSYALAKTAGLTAVYTHTSQGASEKYYAYQRESLNITLTKIFEKGRFALISLTPQFDQYRIADLSISRRVRQDHTYRSTLMFGAPLGFIADPLNSFMLTLTYDYFHSRSNIPNNAYTNNKLSSMLAYRLDL